MDFLTMHFWPFSLLVTVTVITEIWEQSNFAKIKSDGTAKKQPGDHKACMQANALSKDPYIMGLRVSQMKNDSQERNMVKSFGHQSCKIPFLPRKHSFYWILYDCVTVCASRPEERILSSAAALWGLGNLSLFKQRTKIEKKLK